MCHVVLPILSLSLTPTHTYPVCIQRPSETFIFIFMSQQKPYAWFQQNISFTYFSSLNFYKICMVGVKENHSNCTILLTPKSNFFCLVYLDFSVCFIVKQPTRVVVHKTAFEKLRAHPWRTDCACLRLVHDLKIEYRSYSWWD